MLHYVPTQLIGFYVKNSNYFSAFESQIEQYTAYPIDYNDFQSIGKVAVFYNTRKPVYMASLGETI